MERGLKEEKFKIKGMHCKSCADLIELKIGSLDGVESIKVNLMENEALVRFDPERVSLERIKSEIGSLGYKTDAEGKGAMEKELREERLGIGGTDGGKNTESKEAGRGRYRNFMQAVTYGLIPHIGCIAFLIGSIFGVTMLMQFFKPLLMNPYIFHILILISLLFSTFSSVLYLRRNGLLSLAGAKRKRGYLTTMYGSTIGINLLLVMVVFPLLANVSISPSVTGAIIGAPGGDGLSSLKLQVDIPCPGHAPLISQELKSIDGVAGIQFGFPNIFDVTYDSEKTSKEKILLLDVFKTYKASILEESAARNAQQNSQPIQPQITGGGCCGGGGSCGGGGGGCGCGGQR